MRQLDLKASSIRRLVVVLTFAVMAIAGLTSGTFAGNSGNHVWKSVPRAQIKLDDRTPLAWNIFQTTQKKEANLVLIQLGRRYIALDIKTRVAYTVPLSDLRPSGGDFESGDLFVESRVLPTDNWSLRDVGPAELIKLKLNDYGTMLQIELPHAPDLRGLY